MQGVSEWKRFGEEKGLLVGELDGEWLSLGELWLQGGLCWLAHASYLMIAKLIILKVNTYKSKQSLMSGLYDKTLQNAPPNLGWILLML